MKPVYARVLRLQHVRPGPVQRALLGEGSFVLALILVLADLVSPWALLVLPLCVAVLVKTHDLMAGALSSPPHPDGGPGPAARD